MKEIKAVKLIFDKEYPDLQAVSDKLDTLERNSISHINWPGFNYLPEVAFAIAYTEKEILIRFYITEDYFKAEKIHTNEQVCEDSCVEFFVSPAADGIYYNFEFNGIGTCLLGSGTSRRTSVRADTSLVSRIRRRSSAGSKPVAEQTGRFTWDIVAAIPLTAFYRHSIESLQGLTFRANFYKCGDMLSVPHFITWNPVETEKPDFHRPEFFGSIKFI
jgi:hypothetical protein